MARTKRKKKKSGKLSSILISLMMIFGWYLLMYPTSADLLNRIYNVNSISSYQGYVSTYTDEDLETIIQNCVKYNESIYEEQQKTIFRYRGPTATGETYLKLPTNSKEIGTLRIPSIGVNLAIAHGTSDEELQTEAGHLYGTSLPVEGENVHSVIAAHSALSTAKLFTDLGKVQMGEKFYVTVMNRELEYEVDNIVTVLPEDDYKYEQIVPGENYVTLYTCTPYGVNTHRLLVRGKFIQATIKEGQDGGFTSTELFQTLKYSCLLALIILFPFLFMLFVMIIDDHRRAKNKKKKKRMKRSQKGRGIKK